MSQPIHYYRPVPDPLGGRWRLAGGWTGFSSFERLERGRPPVIVHDAPQAVLDRLTSARAPVLGLTMGRPRLMGIVNVTPDSFSDGGLWQGVEAAAAHGRALVAAGADILDVGGESTRPGAVEISAPDEQARVIPVITSLAGSAPLSIDTRKAAVAASAVAAGAGMINDVSGLEFDPDMAATVRRTDAALCIMHAKGLPDRMQDDPHYDDVLLDVYDALDERVARAEAAGIPRDRIVIDPGIGFGKTAGHNLALLARLSLFHGIGVPVLLGVSRKRFIGTIGGAAIAADRDPGTLALTLAAVTQGIQIHRVHEVAALRQGLALWQTVTAINSVPGSGTTEHVS